MEKQRVLRKCLDLLVAPLVGLVVCLIQSAHNAQAQPTQLLLTKASPARKLSAEFGGPTAVRELRDGRVLLVDGREQQLYVADFNKNIATPLGRKGSGPAEYLIAGSLVPIAGDSSLLIDLGNRRWLLFDGATISGVVPAHDPAVIESGIAFVGADRFGNVLAVKSPRLKSGITTITKADSNWVVLVRRGNGVADSVAKVRAKPHARQVAYDNTGRIVQDVAFPTDFFAQGEDAVLFEDGWLALVRLDPIRVDWRAPDGKWTYGKALPLIGDDVTAADRQSIANGLDAAKRTARQFGLPEPKGGTVPRRLPVVSTLHRSLVRSSDGSLLIRRRANGASTNTRYAVIGRDGVVRREVIVRKSEEILGIGAKHVYVTAKDENDVQSIVRYELPSWR
jgi:hypothetical protein